MSLQVDTDDLPFRGQHRHVRREHIDRTQTAVQKQQRRALPADLGVALNSVHVNTTALGNLGRSGFFRLRD